MADRLWEELVLAIIGDQFTDCEPESINTDSPDSEKSKGTTEWPEICGCTISVRQNEDIITVWNRVDDPKVKDKIK